MILQFSPNMLKTFEQCPKKFYYKYIKNISMPVNDDIFEFGKNIHAMASYYLRKENIDKLERSLSKKENEVWQYLKSLKYFSYEVINTEYQLSAKIEDLYYGGRLDALVKSDNHYYILDYKTGSIPQNPKYDFQTIIYTLAVNAFYKTSDIEFVYIDLKHFNETKIKFSDELKNEYIKKLTLITNKINDDEFNTKKSNCSCEYSIICY